MLEFFLLLLPYSLSMPQTIPIDNPGDDFSGCSGDCKDAIIDYDAFEGAKSWKPESFLSFGLTTPAIVYYIVR
jgi:hypothetical protein